MEDLSLHILDIAENSVAANADMIEIRISEDKGKDLLSIEVIDNGVGMDKETLDKALDPFYTSKTVRRFGFGLSLLSVAAKAANGHLSVRSKKGEGTKIRSIKGSGDETPEEDRGTGTRPPENGCRRAGL